MSWLILGATGLLGEALMAEARRRAIAVTGLARSGTDIALDIGDDDALLACLDGGSWEVAINAAAITGLDACEREPMLAYRINARAVAVMAECCRRKGRYFVQISTDHYFTGDGRVRHDETAPVRLVNEYARSKYAGEAFAATCPGALIVRTNFTGFRRRPGPPTFADWALDVIERDAPACLFDDFYTSTLDVEALATALADLIEQRPSGILNVAAREVASKKAFVEALAARLGRTLTRPTPASVSDLRPVRAESLGLDVSRAEALLGRPLPAFDEVIEALARTRKELAHAV